jgi:TonB family protein
MSVEPSEITSEVWTRWQGQVINGVYPLGRYLGCSEHSGVFLTKSAARPAEVAIKLVPTNRAMAESLLPRWKRAGGLIHPHLLRLFEWGGCQLDGLPYLYAVMEYADQTLAQLLLHRALTAEEAQEMLLPILDALAFLHGRNLVHGQLKPTNIMVVGDQLKLASDTIRRVTDSTTSTNAATVFDAPEERHGSGSAAGDVWGLGVSLFEALTRRPYSGLGEPGQAAVLPADFSPAFRDIVARSLSVCPQDRPSVSELISSARGPSAEPAPTVASPQPVTVVTPEPGTPEPALPVTAAPQVAPEASRPAPSMGRSERTRALPTLILAAVITLALGWSGWRVLRSHVTAGPPPPPVQAPAGSQTPAEGPPAEAAARGSVSTMSPTNGGPGAAATSPLHEVVPDVPRGARRTIRGHIKVWVRVIVDQDGSVFAAVADRSGPSGYFQRLALDAAKRWTFTPVDTPSRRVMQIRFDFSRDGATARAVTLH